VSTKREAPSPNATYKQDVLGSTVTWNFSDERLGLKALDQAKKRFRGDAEKQGVPIGHS
jgi:hypothetical protein